MHARKVEIPYNPRAERMLSRVTLLRHGVPERVLDKEIPIR